MWLASLMAMMLVAAAPAFAQDNGTVTNSLNTVTSSLNTITNSFNTVANSFNPGGVLVAAAPASAQDDVTITNSFNFGGGAEATGGDITANNSIVQQCQQFFQVVNNQNQNVVVTQTQTASQQASAFASGTGANATAVNVAAQIAVDVAEQTGVTIGDVEFTCAQAIAAR